MQVYGPTHLHGPQPINPPHAHAASPAPPVSDASSSPISDEVQISDAARMIEQAQQLPDVRQDRVAAIRRRDRPGHLRNAG